MPIQITGRPSLVATDWASYTPTISASFGTATTNISFQWRRIGANLEVFGTFTAGTVTAALGTFTLPSGLVIGTMPITNTTSNPGPAVGTWSPNVSSPQVAWALTATGTSTSLIYMGSNVTPLTPSNANTMSNTIVVSIKISVPISGWTSFS